MIRTLFLLLLSSTLAAQTIVDLYPEGILCGSNRLEATVFRPDVGLLLTDVNAPQLEHHAPVPRAANGRSIMIIPGGGYQVNAWELEGVDIARRFALAGYHAFVLKYRLPGKETNRECATHIALDDARRGVQTIRMLADSLGYATNQVAVMGFSAGGHLAASVAIYPIAGEPDSDVPAMRFGSRPDYSLPIYAVLIMDGTDAGHAGSREALLGKNPDDGLAKKFDLPQMVNVNVPPTFLAHAGDDTSVPVENSLRYYRALIDKGVSAELHVFPTGGHGFGSGVGYEGAVTGWLEMALAWIENQRVEDRW